LGLTNVDLMLIDHARMHVLQQSCAQLSTSFAPIFYVLENPNGHGTRDACTQIWLFETDFLTQSGHLVASTFRAC
jgi:hypothetical protein